MVASDSSADAPAARPGFRIIPTDARYRSIFFQTIAFACVVGLFLWLTLNTMTNLETRNLTTGFGFLQSSAGFGIGFTLIEYQEGDNYLRVFWVGVANTLLVAFIAIILSTFLGLIIGLARLSNNWIIAKLSRAYVELLRNTPLLLQIIAWYFAVFNQLPRPRDSIEMVDGFVLNNRGLYIPSPIPGDGFGIVGITFIATVIFSIGLFIWAGRRRDATGKSFPAIPTGFGIIVVGTVLVYFIMGAPLTWNVPELKGFNYTGGVSVPPSFCALITALAAYTSCFIAEIVRSGIQAVGKGQLEAAGALNLPANWTLRRVVLPQALRVIIPPLISQYLNVTKNSSLAIAIGFPDLVSVWMNTSLNQSGQAIPIVAMTMGFYCFVSLAVSLVMNWYNKRVQLKER